MSNEFCGYCVFFDKIGVCLKRGVDVSKHQKKPKICNYYAKKGLSKE